MNPLTMPPDLRTAHDANDRAVLRTNGMVYDACMGPVCGMEFNAYLQQYIDCSTPNEKNQGYFSDVQEIQALRIAEDGELLGMY